MFSPATFLTIEVLSVVFPACLLATACPSASTMVLTHLSPMKCMPGVATGPGGGCQKGAQRHGGKRGR